MQMETKRMETNGNKQTKKTKARLAILTSEIIDFKTQTITRDKEECYIMIKRSIQLGDIKVVNIYAPNKGAPKYIKQILTDIKEKLMTIK